MKTIVDQYSSELVTIWKALICMNSTDRETRTNDK